MDSYSSQAWTGSCNDHSKYMTTFLTIKFMISSSLQFVPLIIITSLYICPVCSIMAGIIITHYDICLILREVRFSQSKLSMRELVWLILLLDIDKMYTKNGLLILSVNDLRIKLVSLVEEGLVIKNQSLILSTAQLVNLWLLVEKMVAKAD